MNRPRSLQEFVHWLEVGTGVRWILRALLLLAVLLLSLRISYSQFRGPTHETTLVQADVGRQLARGAGFTTQVNYLQTAAVLQARGVRFDATQPYPELHHAPLYSLAIAAGLRLLPEERRAALFGPTASPLDGFRADYFLLGLNLALLWLAAWLTYALGRRLFEPRVGWVAMFALLLSAPVWQQTVSVDGAPLLMVLGLAAFGCWARVETAGEQRGRLRWLGALGLVCGLLFLTEYSAGALVLVALVYGAVRFAGSARWLALGMVAIGFTLAAAPWVARNLSLTGSPTALAVENVALKAGDSTAEPANARATLSAELMAIDLRKLGNKTLTALQESVKARVWAGGAMWLTAFFVAGWLYAFRSEAANRLRWVAASALGVLLLAQAALNSGESTRLATTWFSPVLMIFGAGFFFVLLGSNARLAQWPRAMATILLVLQAMPLLQDVWEPKRIHFSYPPYFPTLFHGMREELDRRVERGRYGIMADVPAGVAWYGDVRAWSQPPKLRDFYAVSLEQPIGELLLTPRTLDRPFFSELNARPVQAGNLSAVANRFGEWGEIYAGLLTGRMPGEFPLGAPQRFAENFYVLMNPALPTPKSR